MSTDLTKIKERLAELENSLEERKEEIAYFRNIATESGKRNLREAEQVSNLISELKEIEESLRNSEERFKSLSENAPDIIFTLDISGVFTYLNPAFKKLLGYRITEYLGKPFSSLLQKEESEIFADHLKKVLGQKMTFRDLKLILIHRDGSHRIFVVSITSNLDSKQNVTGITGLCKDMTDWRRLESRLYQSQRMEAIATLAGGIAHEFNNALMGIQGGIDLLKLDLPDNDKVIKYCKAMQTPVKKMAYLTEHLLAYAKGGKYQPSDICLDDLVKNTVPLIKHKMGPNILFEIDLSSNDALVTADLTQMQLVISSLLLNASEAIEGPGVIKIFTEREVVDESMASENPSLEAGQYVTMRVEDNGKGMDDETIERIFEPFFTTKKYGRGLGMAAVFGIIQNHGGWISFGSEQGKGTNVKIFLPRKEK